MSYKKLFWQIATFLGLVILLASPLNQGLQMVGFGHQQIVPSVVKTVEAKEVYDMFSCPCCGQPLQKEEPCCGAMTQMVDFIDQKITTGASKDAVVLATAQEFGLERLLDESDRSSLRERLIAQAPEDAPRITLAESKKDLGIVSQQDGIVSTLFTIKNEGKSDLVVDKLSSSCGCTSASLIYQGEEGPRFYMAGHGHDEPDASWQVSIAPSDEAQIKVYYDPTVHPDLVGSVTRTVSVHTNDPVDFETKITITLEQEK